MTDVSRSIAEAASHLDVSWDESKWSALEAGVQRRRARRRRRNVALAAAALLLLAFAPLGYLKFAAEKAPVVAAGAPASAAPSENVRRLEDGSVAVLGVGAELVRSLDAAPGAVFLELLAGVARFDVVPHAPGTFRVVAADVRVQVVGTTFSVERRASSVKVSVIHGRVKVSQGEKPAFYVSAGESRELSIASKVSSAPGGDGASELLGGAPRPTSSTEVPSELSDERLAAKGQKPSKDWRALAHEGDFEGAYRVRGRSNGGGSEQSAGDLLLAADVARLSGHPGDAVAPLRKLLKEHPSDPRAPLAAFTLGRVLLDELGDPRAAALAFASVRRIDPASPLDENALSRSVEAWSRVGELSQARRLAEEYLRKYPQGSKVKLVRHYASMD